MPDTPNTQQSTSTGGAATPSQQQTQQSTQTQQSSYQLPAELNGKSAAEVGEWYAKQSERYKDYDDIKGRAEKYAEYEGLQVTPEQIRNSQQWVTQLLGGMQQGKAAVLKNGRIEYLDIPANQVTPQQQQALWNEGYELLDPTQQSERLAGHIWKDMLTPEITKVVDRYNTEHKQALEAMDQKFALFMDALEAWQSNPKLKIRDVLQRANERMKTNPSDYIRMAAEELMSPEQQQAAVQAEVARQMAEFQAKWDEEHKAAPILPSPLAGSHRMGADTRPKNLSEVRQQFHRVANGTA